MKAARGVSAVFLTFVALCGAAAPWIAPHHYAEQQRSYINTAAGRQFPLGTDDVGRDRLSRLLYATGVSTALAPAAAVISVALALAFSLLSVSRLIPLRYGVSTISTLSLSLPWIFPFIMLRSLLPLNTNPGVSIVLTFALLGIAGWAFPGRVFISAMQEITQAEWLLLARASGLKPWRVFMKQVLPHVTSLAFAQFRILIPAYVLSEASLGLLGLGVAEPLPSWGNMLAELQHPDRVQSNPAIAAPLLLIMAVMVSFELLGRSEDCIA